MANLIFSVACFIAITFFSYDSWRKHRDKYYLWYILILSISTIDQVWKYCSHHLLTLSHQQLLTSDSVNFLIQIVDLTAFLVVGILQLIDHYKSKSNLKILTDAINSVASLKDDDHLEGSQTQRALAAIKIIKDKGNEEIKKSLKDSINKCLDRILKDPRIKSIWKDSDKYENWCKTVEGLRISN